MIPDRRQLVKYAAKLFDLCVLLVSFVVTAAALYLPPKSMTFAEFMAIQIKLGNVVLFAVLLLTGYSIFVFCGLYISKRLTSWRTQISEVSKASLLACAFLLAAGKAFHIQMVTWLFVSIFGVVCTCLMVAGRLAASSFLVAFRSRGRNQRFVLIVGTNDRAMELAREMTEHPELGYRIVGFVDDDWFGIAQFEATGLVRCCTFDGLADFLRHNVVDEAAMYLPLRSYYQHAAELVSLCEHHGIAIRFDTQIFKRRKFHTQAHELDENLQVWLADSPGFWPIIVKGTLDRVISGLLLITLTPLLLLVAILIKCTSPGPVFFRQTRIGLNKRRFRIFKFRTMIANAELIQEELLPLNEMTGPVFKIRNDPRVTALGRVLRKTSIDELPQLINVLTGDMSLVGPRAMSLRDYQLFDQDWQRRRFSVKPGITCLWQVSGRNSIPFEQWMELDMQYIDRWSLWLDLKILARTLPAVLRGTGAA